LDFWRTLLQNGPEENRHVHFRHLVHERKKVLVSFADQSAFEEKDVFGFREKHRKISHQRLQPTVLFYLRGKISYKNIIL